MEKTVWIFDPDRDYCERLAAGLRDIPEFPAAVRSFTEAAELKAFFHEEQADVLLIDEQTVDEEIRRNYGGRMVYLSDVRGYSFVDNVRALYKFQPVSRLSEELMGVLDEKEAEASRPVASLRRRYIGIVSPVGRCMKTGFAFVLGQLYSAVGKVLLVSLELCGGYKALLGECFDTDLSELLFAAEAGENGMREFAGRELPKFHGVEIIAPVLAPEDLYRTAPEKVRRAVFALAEEGDYDTVIFDLGTDYPLIETFLPELQKIYLPSRQDPLQEEKMREFKEWLFRVGGEGTAEKTELLKLPMVRAFSPGSRYLEQLLWSELGDYVRSVAGEACER